MLDTKSIDQNNTLEQVAKMCDGKQSNMFATFDSIDQLVERQGLRGEQVVIALMAVNTALNMISKHIREEMKIPE